MPNFNESFDFERERAFAASVGADYLTEKIALEKLIDDTFEFNFYWANETVVAGVQESRCKRVAWRWLPSGCSRDAVFGWYGVVE